MTRPTIHESVAELMDDADARQETLGWSDEQKAVMRHYLELAWNRGHKAGYEQALDDVPPTTAG